MIVVICQQVHSGCGARVSLVEALPDDGPDTMAAASLSCNELDGPDSVGSFLGDGPDDGPDMVTWFSVGVSCTGRGGPM